MRRARLSTLCLMLALLTACREDAPPVPAQDVSPTHADTAPAPPAPPLVAAARAQIGIVRIYDPAYFSVSYPGGDVPADRGVCTDVIIRALRTQGLDLQRAIHEDMRAHFDRYPRQWGLSRPDRNIDHRRVPNQMRWFERNGWASEHRLFSGRFLARRHRGVETHRQRPAAYPHRLGPPQPRRHATDPAQHQRRHAGKRPPVPPHHHRPLPAACGRRPRRMAVARAARHRASPKMRKVREFISSFRRKPESIASPLALIRLQCKVDSDLVRLAVEDCRNDTPTFACASRAVRDASTRQSQSAAHASHLPDALRARFRASPRDRTPERTHARRPPRYRPR